MAAPTFENFFARRSGEVDLTKNSEESRVFGAEDSCRNPVINGAKEMNSAHSNTCIQDNRLLGELTSPAYLPSISPGAPPTTPITPLKHSNTLSPLHNPWSPYDSELDNSLLTTDTSSILDETLPTFTEDDPEGCPISSGTALVGLGIAGLDDALGLHFACLRIQRDGDEEEEEDAFLGSIGAPCSGAPPQQSTPARVHDGVFLTPSTSPSGWNSAKRDASGSTISSALKRLKAGKVAQKGRRVGPVWKL